MGLTAGFIGVGFYWTVRRDSVISHSLYYAMLIV